jgi:hypothetical protein
MNLGTVTNLENNAVKDANGDMLAYCRTILRRRKLKPAIKCNGISDIRQTEMNKVEP